MARPAPYRIGALGSCVVAAVVLVALAWHRPEQSDHTPVVFVWGAGLVAFLVAAGALPVLAGMRRWRPDRWWGFAAAIVAVALVLRLVRLARYPRVIDADGMAFALVAREIADGRFRDPFSTGYLDHPAMWSYAQRAVLALTGESLVGARTLSVLVGTAAVAATIAWGRRLGGWSVGLVAGVLLATSPMHLHFSRLALNNVSDSLALPLVIVLLDRGLVARDRLAAASAGVVLGLAQYGYLGARALIPVAGLAAIVLLVRAHRHGELAAAGRLGGWAVAGALLAVAPLAMHYLEHPADLTARDSAVSIFARWLDDEAERTGHPELRVVLEQAGRGALLPASDGSGTYHPPAPLVGWPLLLAAAVGLGVLLARCPRDRHAATLLVTWLVPLAAVATTIDLQSHRWVVGTPVVALTGAVGLIALWRVVAARVPGLGTSRRLGAAVVVGAVLALGAVNGVTFFRSAATLRDHGDLNSLVATELAAELRALEPGTAVYAAFAPRMTLRTHATVPFLAPRIVAQDLAAPILGAADVPDAAPGSLFVFLPERLDELDVVRRRHPGGETRTVAALGQQLYTSYRTPAVEP